MAAGQVTVEKVLKNKIMRVGFKSTLYSPYLQQFTDLVNSGMSKDPMEVLRDMMVVYSRYIHVSRGMRTVAFDFAWAVLDQNPQFWNEEEKSNGFSNLPSHQFQIYPELDSEAKNADIATLEYGEYFVYAMDLCFIRGLEDSCKNSFCYSMYRFFERWSFQMGKEEADEAKDIIKERIRNGK